MVLFLVDWQEWFHKPEVSERDRNINAAKERNTNRGLAALYILSRMSDTETEVEAPDLTTPNCQRLAALASAIEADLNMIADLGALSSDTASS